MEGETQLENTLPEHICNHPGCGKQFATRKALKLHWYQLPDHDPRIKNKVSEQVEELSPEHVLEDATRDELNSIDDEIEADIERDTMIALKELRLARVKARIRDVENPYRPPVVQNNTSSFDAAAKVAEIRKSAIDEMNTVRKGVLDEIEDSNEETPQPQGLEGILSGLLSDPKTLEALISKVTK